MAEFADQFNSDIAAIDSLQPVAEISDRVRVMALAASIRKATDRGVTWIAIEECLRGLGITASSAAVKNYVRAAGVRRPSRRQKTASLNQVTRYPTPSVEDAFPKPTKIRVSGASVGESRNPMQGVKATISRPTTMKSGGASVEQIRPDSEDL